MKPLTYFYSHIVLLSLVSMLAASAQTSDQPATPAPSTADQPKFAAGPIPELPGWLSKLELAREQAKTENKNLLIEFAGSDWCPPCIDLEERVLSKDAFVSEAKKTFVLVRLDNPRARKSQSEEVRESVAAALKLYGVQEFPTLVLADNLGRPYTRTGYRAEGPEDYLKHLIDLTEKRNWRDQLFAKAEKMEGMEKAKAYSEFLSTLTLHEMKNFYREAYMAVRELDPKGTHGLADMMFLDDKVALERELDQLALDQEWDALVDRIDLFLEEKQLEKAQLQEILMFKLGPLLRQRAESELFATLDQVIAIDPENRFGRQATNLKEPLRAELEKAVKSDASPETTEGGQPEAPTKADEPGTSPSSDQAPEE